MKSIFRNTKEYNGLPLENREEERLLLKYHRQHTYNGKYQKHTLSSSPIDHLFNRPKTDTMARYTRNRLELGVMILTLSVLTRSRQLQFHNHILTYCIQNKRPTVKLPIGLYPCGWQMLTRNPALIDGKTKAGTWGRHTGKPRRLSSRNCHVSFTAMLLTVTANEHSKASETIIGCRVLSYSEQLPHMVCNTIRQWEKLADNGYLV